MRTMLLLVVAATAFVIGAGAGFFASVYLQDITAGTIVVRGVVKFDAQEDPSASGLPPKGYYIEATAVERFYIDSPLAEQHLGELVQASGKLHTLCGPDSVNCYPVVRQPSLVSASQAGPAEDAGRATAHR